MKIEMLQNEYDVLIVGAGIAGSSLAHALSTLPRPEPLRIALIERSLAEPDRIVGELLQPGGYSALKQLGLGSCVEGIDAIPSKGYCVLDVAAGRSINIPYPGGHEGRSFHHGRLITNLRNAAKRAMGVEVIEATVTDLIEDQKTMRVIGVHALRKNNDSKTIQNEMAMATDSSKKQSFYATLVIIADGCFSNLRTAVMGPAGAKPITTSQTVGVLLKDAELPVPGHGLVVLTKGYGPAVLYQTSQHSTRVLIDVKAPLPSDLKSHILNNISPQLPASLQLPLQIAVNNDRLRRMPNSFLPPVMQGGKEGVILLGDSWNMRHPLTGGGMTVALNDVVQLRALIGSVSDMKDWGQMRNILHSWHWNRKPLSSTINIMSIVVYIFSIANDEEIAVLRNGWFKYLEKGGESVEGSVALLSGINPSPLLLAAHLLDIVLYSIWLMFTQPPPVHLSQDSKSPCIAPRIHQYPFLFIKALKVLWRGCTLLCPLVWSEIRWWAPTDSRRRNIVLSQLAFPLLALMGGLLWTSFRVM